MVVKMFVEITAPVDDITDSRGIRKFGPEQLLQPGYLAFRRSRDDEIVTLALGRRLAAYLQRGPNGIGHVQQGHPVELRRLSIGQRTAKPLRETRLGYPRLGRLGK
jgi:hypothetical protein